MTTSFPLRHTSTTLKRQALRDLLPPFVHAVFVHVGSQDAWSVVSVPEYSLLALPPLDRPYLAVFVEDTHGTRLVWGYVSVAQLLAERFDRKRLVVELHRNDGRDSAEALMDATLPNYHGAAQTLPLPRDGLSLDAVERLMRLRWEAYQGKRNAIADMQCSRAEDHASYVLLLMAAMVHDRDVWRSDGIAEKQCKAVRTWYAGECALVRSRIYRGIQLTGPGLREPTPDEWRTPMLSGLQNAPLLGTPFEHTQLLPHVSLLVRGMCFEYEGFWAGRILPYHDACHRLNALNFAMPDVCHPGLRRLWMWWHIRLRGDACIPRCVRTNTKRPFASLAPSIDTGDIEDLGQLIHSSPACMRHLAQRAAYPLRNKQDVHLKHTPRHIFYSYALAAGMPADTLRDLVTKPFRGDSKYVKKLEREVQSTAKDVETKPTSLGYSCKRLQAEGYCEFFKGDAGAARIACHQNQNTMLRREHAPGWAINFPLVFARQVREARQTAKRPRPSQPPWGSNATPSTSCAPSSAEASSTV